MRIDQFSSSHPHPSQRRGSPRGFPLAALIEALAGRRANRATWGPEPQARSDDREASEQERAAVVLDRAAQSPSPLRPVAARDQVAGRQVCLLYTSPSPRDRG